MEYSSILLISIDALSKKYSKYFYPYFNEYYLNYQTTNTWTLPGHFTMLTGQVLPELYFQPKIKDALNYKFYIKSIPTIASFFRKINFKTKAITGGGFMSKYFGWGDDWDEWLEAENSEEEWRGEEIKIEKKSFVFLHTYYVHNWFEDSPKLNSLFTINRKKLDELKRIPKKHIIDAKKLYINRIKFLAQKLNWLKKLNKDILVILTSDHGELFFEDNKTFHHGNFALKNNEIFRVPLMMKTKENKKVIKEVIYDFYLPMLILKKIKKEGEEIYKFKKESDILREQLNQTKTHIENLQTQINTLTSQNTQLSQQLSQKSQEIEKLKNQIPPLHLHIQNLETQLNTIKSSKFFKLWQRYCKIRDKILGRNK